MHEFGRRGARCERQASVSKIVKMKIWTHGNYSGFGPRTLKGSGRQWTTRSRREEEGILVGFCEIVQVSAEGVQYILGDGQGPSTRHRLW